MRAIKHIAIIFILYVGTDQTRRIRPRKGSTRAEINIKCASNDNSKMRTDFLFGIHRTTHTRPGKESNPHSLIHRSHTHDTRECGTVAPQLEYIAWSPEMVESWHLTLERHQKMDFGTSRRHDTGPHTIRRYYLLPPDPPWWPRHDKTPPRTEIKNSSIYDCAQEH